MANPLDALLELHTINKQRSRLMHAERKRQSGVRKAQKAVAEASAAAERAAAGTNQADALIRSLTADITALQNTIAGLKEQQLAAGNNKAYLAAINEAEIARADLGAKQNRLKTIENAAASQEAAATAAAEAQAKAEADLAAEQAKAQPDSDAAGALQRLQALFEQKRQAVDPELLSTYERLVKAGHRQPLLAVDPVTGATALGNRLPTSQVEQLRRGEVVIDMMTKAILHLAAPVSKADDDD